MITPKVIYVNIQADDPTESLAFSANNLTGKSMGTVISGDLMNYLILPYPSTAVGVANTASYQLRVGIGRYDLGTLARSDFFYTSASYGWSGSLNLNTASLTNVMNSLGEETLEATFEIVLQKSSNPNSGSQITIVQSPIIIRQQILS